MQSTYAIVWVARNKDRSGVSPKRFSKEQADKLAAELNESHPEFVHLAVDTESQEVAQSLIELKEKIFGVAQPIDYSAFAATSTIVEDESMEEEPALQS
jgi:hypothetical protein